MVIKYDLTDHKQVTVIMTTLVKEVKFCERVLVLLHETMFYLLNLIV